MVNIIIGDLLPDLILSTRYQLSVNNNNPQKRSKLLRTEKNIIRPLLNWPIRLFVKDETR